MSLSNRASSDTHCYADGAKNSWEPCGPVNETNPVVSCCNPGDYCLSNGICHYTHSLTGGSGYYAGGCTDPNFDSPECYTRCANKPPDVVWLDDKTEPSLWACCAEPGTTKYNCADPSNETLVVAPLSSLSTFFFVPSSGFDYTSQAIESSTATREASAPAMATSLSDTASTKQSQGLSPGAAAGIAFAAAAVLFLLGIGAFVVWRYHKKHGQAQRLSHTTYTDSHFSRRTSQQSVSKMTISNRTELPGKVERMELAC